MKTRRPAEKLQEIAVNAFANALRAPRKGALTRTKSDESYPAARAPAGSAWNAERITALR